MSFRLPPVRASFFALTASLSFAGSGAALVGCGGGQEEAVTPPRIATAANAPDSSKPAPIEDEGGPVPVSSADPMVGNRNALVTIVEIADFQCPFCARGSAIVDALRREYGPEKVRVVWKHLPLDFHPEARPAAEVSAAVMLAGGSAAFWSFHDKLFADQMSLSRASFAEWAKESGADPVKVRAAIDNGSARAKVDSDMAMAKQIGATGTPAFFINGVPLVGAQPPERFKAVIDVELEKARAKLGSGVAPAKLYAAMATENFKKAPSEDEGAEDDKNVYRIPVGKSPARGPANALVTVVVFSDFQCSFCKRAEATLAEVESRYPGALRFVWKNLPLSFHKRAEPAAQLALEARAQKGEQGFWDAQKKLFAALPELETADLERVAKELSLDVKKAMDAVRTHKHKAQIEADMALAEDFQVQGTPQFFVNGHRVVGAQPAGAFVAVIDEALARAKAVLAKGAAPADVYEAVIKDGVGPAEPEKRTIQVTSDATTLRSPAVGAATAPVTLYVYSDFQCPYCKRVEPTVAELRKTYGAKLRVVWKNLPLPSHPDAHLAAQAAMEGQAQKGDAGFWKMHAALFDRQRDDGTGLDREGLDAAAKVAGLDAKRFAAALDEGTHKARVDDDAKSASRAGISGTPTFVVVAETTGPTKTDKTDKAVTATGYVIAGAQPVGKFKKLIDRALADAKSPPKKAAAAEEKRP